MKSWNPEAVEAMIVSQGIRLAPGRAARIDAGLNAAPAPADPLLSSLEFETDPTSYALALGRHRSK